MSSAALALIEERNREDDVPFGLLKALGFSKVGDGLYIFKQATGEGTLHCYVDYEDDCEKPGLYSYLNGRANELWRQVEAMQVIRRYHEDQLASEDAE